MSDIHPTRAARVADLSLQIQNLQADLRDRSKPVKELIKELKKMVEKLLEHPEKPFDPSVKED